MNEARIAHVGIAVHDVEAAAAFYRDVLHLEPHSSDEADGATILSFALGEGDVELLSPLSTDGPIARFLARRGPGIHHICYRVPDLEEAMARCRELGYVLIDDQPRRGAGGRRIAFLHPKSTNGVLLELTE